MPTTIEFVFLDSSELWVTVSRLIGREMMQSMLHIKEYARRPDGELRKDEG